MQINPCKTTFSLAEKTGILALGAAFLLFFVNPALAVLPLVLFIVLCFCAPFWPRFGFFLPIISKAQPGVEGIVLTFDDGPSPSSTPLVLELLARYKLPATFFVVGEKAAAYPELIADILAQGHTIGNHSWKHDPFLALRSHNTLQKDLQRTQEVLHSYGVQPLVFRPPVGITSSRLTKVVTQEGFLTVTFSCRAFDRGNRNVLNLARKIIGNLQPGDIIMLHDLPPNKKNMANCWQKELEHLFAVLAKNYNIVSLEQAIGHPVMLITE